MRSLDVSHSIELRAMHSPTTTQHHYGGATSRMVHSPHGLSSSFQRTSSSPAIGSPRVPSRSLSPRHRLSAAADAAAATASPRATSSSLADSLRDTLRDPALRSSTQPWEWRKSVKDQISSAQRDQMSAETLRNTQRKVRRSAVTARKALDFQVNTALRKRLEETRVSKDRLKAQLSRVDAEIRELEEAKRKVELTLQDKLNHLRVSGHCMRRRTHRPERERVRDEGTVPLLSAAWQTAAYRFV